jgi:hypothetical protein
MLGFVPHPAWIAPRAALDDRGRSVKINAFAQAVIFLQNNTQHAAK